MMGCTSNIDQVRQTLQTLGLLWVGDCKMSALATRAHPSPPALLPDALNTGGQSARVNPAVDCRSTGW